jgi:hypothetical protein
MGSRRPAPGSKNTIKISTDMLREILVKLPTKDVARSCCVSKLWHSVANDPSFRNLHAMASHVTSARTEALLITVRHDTTARSQGADGRRPSAQPKKPSA